MGTFSRLFVMTIRYFEILGRKKPNPKPVDAIKANLATLQARVEAKTASPAVHRELFRAKESLQKAVEKYNVEATKVYRMKIFSSNTVVTRSRFWYYLSKMRKIKRANGEIISVSEIFEKNKNQVKNYGVAIRYDSRSGTHNMYKEYRDTSICGAVEQMYTEMASRHRARKRSVQIVKISEIAAKTVKRPNMTQFIDGKIAFQLLHRIPRVSSKRYDATFKASAPCT